VIKIKKIIFITIKSGLALVVLLTLILFFYAAFFYEPPLVEKKTTENNELKSEKLSDIEKENKLRKEEEQKLKKLHEQKKIKIKTTIKDGIFATVGNKVITKSDIINEIKMILILSNKGFSEDKRKELQQMAIKSIIKKNIKKIEIERNNYLEFNKQDLKKEILRLANNINTDIDTLKNIFSSNELDFTILEDQIKTELLWNSLIFQLYKNRISINLVEIDEQLKLIQDKKEIEEYLISEIVINPVTKDKLESVIEKLKNRIKVEGFESVAASSSISDSATRSGDLGWINENIISKKLLSVIANTPVGNISEPILLPNGILIFKIRDKKIIEKKINMEEVKNQLVNTEKERILNMHSSSHYSSLRRSISINFFNE